MSKYLLNENTKMVIKDISLDGGLSLNKNKVIVYDNEFIYKIIIKKLQMKYQNLMLMFNKMLEDSDEDSSAILLDELEKFESILVNKYQNFLKKEVYRSYLNKISNLKEGIKKLYLKKGRISKR